MNRKFRTGISSLIVVLVVVTTTCVQAQTPIGASEANGWDSTGAVGLHDYSGERDTAMGAAGRTVINTINGSGISADGTTHAIGAPWANAAMFNSSPGGDSGTFGNPGVFGVPNAGSVASDVDGSGTDSAHWVTYQFDQTYTLSQIDIWNDNQTTYSAQGWKNLVVQVSENNGTSASDWRTVYDGELPKASGSATEPVSLTLDLTNAPELDDGLSQWVMLINKAYVGSDQASWVDEGAWPYGGWTVTNRDDHTGVSEVRFYGTSTLVPGDVDGDGDVDADDYSVIRMNMFTQVGSRTQGDLVFDGIVNFADFKEWKSRASASVLAEVFGAAVPEPGSMVLLGILAVGFGGCRRLRRC